MAEHIWITGNFTSFLTPIKVGLQPQLPIYFRPFIDGCDNPYIHWDDPPIPRPSAALRGAVSSEGPTCQLATLAATEALDVTRRGFGRLRGEVLEDHPT